MSGDRKAGLSQQEWMARFARAFPTRRFQPFELETYAFNAWECADPDQDPDEAAEAELAYMREDSR